MWFDPDLDERREPRRTMQAYLLIHESRETLHLIEDGLNL
jgi:hypothetical protein